MSEYRVEMEVVLTWVTYVEADSELEAETFARSELFLEYNDWDIYSVKIEKTPEKSGT